MGVERSAAAVGTGIFVVIAFILSIVLSLYVKSRTKDVTMKVPNFK